MATPATHLPTRQQLDEIDALLQRMLSLPAPAGDRAEEPPTSVTFPAPVVREVPPPQPPAPGDPAVHAWRVEWMQQPPAPAPHPAAPPPVTAWGAPVTPPAYPPWAEPPFATPVPSAGPAPYAAPVPMPGAPLCPPPVPPRARPPQSPAVQLLGLLNGVFDLPTYLLGPLGGWLRGPGRAAVGWLGLGMLLAAAAWAVGDWYGYDWPRPALARLGVGR